MLIYKLPQKFDPVIPPPINPEKKREFLTQPTSWAKVFVGVVIVGLVVWININQSQKLKVKSQNKTLGKIAGAETVREQKDNQETTGLPAIEFPISQDNSDLSKTILLSEDVGLLFETGVEAMEKDNLALAQIAFIRLTQIAPEYKDAWYYLGYTFLKQFEKDPIIKYADPKPTNLDWALVALNRAHLIAPLDEEVAKLLKKTEEIKISL